ncbi:MAG: arsenic resistance N-acetyltransferase ArsN2 [Anaerolineales bacterium]
MTPEISFRNATVADWPHVATLLTSAHLPLDGAQSHLHDFVLALCDEELIGCAGLERYGEAALLRSVAVRESERGTGLGQRLVNAALERVRAGGIRCVVLLTETARDYFPRFGFRAIPRTDAPEAVKASIEFTSACPDSATVMMLTL